MFTLSAWLQQNRRSKTWLGFAFITIISCVAIMLPEQIQQLFFYQYSAIEQAEYWRLLTGHLMHSNNWHLVMNLAGLGLVYLLHGRYYTAWSIILYVGCTALGISYLLIFFAPEIKVYVGLSGVLHALLCIGAFKDIQHKEPTGKILFFGLIAKVGYEQWQGPDADLAQLINANVAIDAHLYGVISGFILAFMLSSTAFIQALKTATKPK